MSAPIRSADPKKVILINPRYPYGKSSIFMGGSSISIAARLHAMGNEVKFFDLNYTHPSETELKDTDLIGISLTGAPYIPGTITLIEYLRTILPTTPILLGGQALEALEAEEFQAVFGNLPQVFQVRSDNDIAVHLGCNPPEIPSPMDVSFIPVWESMPRELLRLYLQNEMTLVISQGCHFACSFCAAKKGRKESFRTLEVFERDLVWLARAAEEFGIKKIHFYTSSLDFFQNSDKACEYLESMARVQRESGIEIRTRCLSCIASLNRAAEIIPDLGKVLKESGLYCVGLGADGMDELLWKKLKKGHNTVAGLVSALDLLHYMGVHAEILLVLGFPQDTLLTLLKTVITSIVSVLRWPNLITRPYLAKPHVPGNDEWKNDKEIVRKIIAHPRLFYNLDFCAIASAITHPRTTHRWMSNTAYLSVCALALIGKSTTSPLLPQGEAGLYGACARVVNKLMPFDR